MATLTVRDVDDDVAQALKRRATAHGRSAEAEHRLILREVLAPREAEVEVYAAAAARLRARLRHQGDAAEIVRAARDGRRGVTPPGVVVDASVALKWVVDEDGSAEAALLLDGRPLHAPPLLLFEAANALRVMARCGAIDGAGAADALDLLRRAPLVRPPTDLLPQALQLAQVLEHPVYDCVYLALALVREVPVITADPCFVAAAARDPDLAILVRSLT